MSKKASVPSALYEAQGHTDVVSTEVGGSDPLAWSIVPKRDKRRAAIVS